ncbi:hypothetical protein Tco_0377543 [Tanacetum coccineum]
MEGLEGDLNHQAQKAKRKRGAKTYGKSHDDLTRSSPSPQAFNEQSFNSLNRGVCGPFLYVPIHRNFQLYLQSCRLKNSGHKFYSKKLLLGILSTIVLPQVTSAFSVLPLSPYSCYQPQNHLLILLPGCSLGYLGNLGEINVRKSNYGANGCPCGRPTFQPGNTLVPHCGPYSAVFALVNI